jgi:uncharacterized protein YecE (DUF72 family)
MLMIGTSGWQYADWRGRFYPARLAQAHWLEFYAERFPTVEVNNAFYRLPERSTFEQWRARTPDGFIVAVKMSRYLTHIKRLNDPAEPVARFLGRAEALGDRLGPVLLQLPPTLRADADALAATLRRFPSEVRVAVEPRHDSWWAGDSADDVRRILEKQGAALCWADRGGRVLTPLWRTADFGYVRLHEGRANPPPRYGRTALESWLERIRDGFGKDISDTVYVYFNNDHGAAAIDNAKTLERMAERSRK